MADFGGFNPNDLEDDHPLVTQFQPGRPKFDLNPKGPDGYMPLKYKGKEYKVYGGPYRNKPDEMLGVKMAMEINMPCVIDVPTRDFDVPNLKDLKRGVVEALMWLEEGKEVYVGCMGGIGRTGLFMACLAKQVGMADPIGHVRATYKGHAVETQEQKAYVGRFSISRDELGGYRTAAIRKKARMEKPIIVEEALAPAVVEVLETQIAAPVRTGWRVWLKNLLQKWADAL